MLKKLALSMAKPIVKQWIASRALRLPVAKAQDLARRLSVPVDAVYAVNDVVVDQVLGEIDKVTV